MNRNVIPSKSSCYGTCEKIYFKDTELDTSETKYALFLSIHYCHNLRQFHHTITFVMFVLGGYELEIRLIV